MPMSYPRPSEKPLVGDWVTVAYLTFRLPSGRLVRVPDRRFGSLQEAKYWWEHCPGNCDCFRSLWLVRCGVVGAEAFKCGNTIELVYIKFVEKIGKRYKVNTSGKRFKI